MAQHNDLGKWGEQLAVAYLKSNNYTILHKNWTYRKAEIDIIARKDDILAAIEVKTRSSIAYGKPETFVSPKKIQLLVQAVNQYIIENDLDLEVRFDIVSVYKNGDVFETEHFTDAFFYF